MPVHTTKQRSQSSSLTSSVFHILLLRFHEFFAGATAPQPLAQKTKQQQFLTFWYIYCLFFLEQWDWSFSKKCGQDITPNLLKFSPLLMQNNLYWIKYDQYIAIILLLMHFLESKKTLNGFCAPSYTSAVHTRQQPIQLFNFLRFSNSAVAFSRVFRWRDSRCSR